MRQPGPPSLDSSQTWCSCRRVLAISKASWPGWVAYSAAVGSASSHWSERDVRLEPRGHRPDVSVFSGSAASTASASVRSSRCRSPAKAIPLSRRARAISATALMPCQVFWSGAGRPRSGRDRSAAPVRRFSCCARVSRPARVHVHLLVATRPSRPPASSAPRAGSPGPSVQLREQRLRRQLAFVDEGLGVLASTPGVRPRPSCAGSPPRPTVIRRIAACGAVVRGWSRARPRRARLFPSSGPVRSARPGSRPRPPSSRTCSSDAARVRYEALGDVSHRSRRSSDEPDLREVGQRARGRLRRHALQRVEAAQHAPGRRPPPFPRSPPAGPVSSCGGRRRTRRRPGSRPAPGCSRSRTARASRRARRRSPSRRSWGSARRSGARSSSRSTGPVNTLMRMRSWRAFSRA